MAPATTRRIHAVVGMTIALDLMGLGLILPLKPFLAESFGASATQVTLLTACFAGMQLLFSPLWGRVSDRVGRRPVILASVSLNGAAYLLFALAGDLAALFVARALGGMASASIPTAQAIIADTTGPGERTGGMGIVGAAFGVGFVVGPTLGGALAQLDPRAPALAAAALCLVDLTMAALWLPETRRVTPRASAAATRGSLRLPGHFVQLVALLALTKAAMSLSEQCVGLLIEARWIAHQPGTAIAESAALTSVVLVCVGLVAVVVQGLAVRRLARRYGEQALISAGGVLAATAMALVTLAAQASFAALVIVFALSAVGTSLLLPATLASLSNAVGGHRTGHAMGLAQSFSGLGRVIGPVCAGWLFDVHTLLPFIVAAALFAAVPTTLLTHTSAPTSAGTSATEAA